MPQTTDNLSEFVSEFPWLERLGRLERRYPIDRYAINVQRADATLLFRLPDNAFGSERVADLERDMEAQQEEFLGVVMAGSLSRAVYYEPVREVFAHEAFDEVEYLVWATLQNWYKRLPGGRRSHDSFKERVMKATIYKPPREGFAELYRTARMSDAVLTDRYLYDLLDAGNPDGVAIRLRLGALAGEFAAGVYSRGGMRKQILEAYQNGSRGMSTNGGGATIRSYVLNGCILINLSDSQSQITFWGFVDEKDHEDEGLRWQGMNSWPAIHGSVPQIEELLQVASAQWPMPSFKPRKIRGPF